MNMRLFGKAILYAGALLLMGALVIAQAPVPKKSTNPPTNQATAHDAAGAPATERKSGSVIVLDNEGSADESSDHDATNAKTIGRRNGSVIAADFNYREGKASDVESPRDPASGHASGRVDQYPKASGAISEQVNAQADSIVSPRDPASGHASGREASSGMATGRRQYQPFSTREASAGQATGIVSPRDSASGQASGREASSGMATGRRQHEPPIVVEDNARNSAHATETLSVTEKGDMSGVHNNPMYEKSDLEGDMAAKKSNTSGAVPAARGGNLSPLYDDNGLDRNNALHQNKDKVSARPMTNAPAVQPYKDGEDMTTRNRPGNNKTSKTNSKSQNSESQAH